MPTVPRLSGPSVKNIGIPTATYHNNHTTLNVAGLGSAIAHLGNAIQGSINKERDEANATAVQDAETQFMQYGNDRLYGQGGAMTQKGKDTFGAWDGVSSDLDKKASELSKNLSDEGRKVFQQRVQQHMLTTQRSVLQHTNQQFGAYQNQQTDSFLATQKQTASLNYTNPELVNQSVDRGLAALHEQADRNGWDSDTTKQKMMSFQSGVYRSTFAGIMQNSPHLAPDFLAAHQKDMTPDDYAKAETTLRSNRTAVQADQYATSLLGDSLPKSAQIGVQPVVPPSKKPSDMLHKLLPAQIHQESGGNDAAVSHKGAVGRMQLMPSTAADMAAKIGVPYDPQKLKTDGAYNQQLGEAYMQEQLDNFGDNPVLALAAYNAGPGTVRGWIAKYGDPSKGEISEADFAAKIPYKETRDYVRKITAKSGVELSHNKMVASAGNVATDAQVDAPEPAPQENSLPGYLRGKTGAPDLVTDRPALNPPDLQGALTKLDKSALPADVREMTRARMLKMYGQWAQQNHAAYNEAMDSINQGQSFSQLPSALVGQLTKEQHQLLRRWDSGVTSGIAPKTDFGVYSGLLQSAEQTPDLFMGINLNEHRADLSQQDYQTISQIQSSMKGGNLKPLKMTHFNSVQTLARRTFLKAMGWDAENNVVTGKQNQDQKDRTKVENAHRKAVTNAFLQQVNQNVNDLEEQQGKTATREQQLSIVDNMLMQVTKPINSPADSLRVFNMKVTDIPDDDRNSIVNALRNAGKPVTDLNVKRLYLQSVSNNGA